METHCSNDLEIGYHQEWEFGERNDFGICRNE